MLDLKAKLAAAGLVSAADIAAAERKPNRPAGPRGPDPKASSGDHSGDHSGPRANQAERPAQGNSSGPRDPHGNQSGRNNPGPRDHNNPGRNNPGRNNPGPRDHRSNQPRNHQGPPGKPRPLLDVAALQSGNKGEAYDAIRRAVDHSRLDPAHGIPGEHAEAFHFSTAAGQLSRLTLEPEARAALTEGSAGLIAFMSHHGLAHCVVPRPLAEAVHAIFPLWLRVLKDHPGAGQAAPRPEPAATPTAAATPETTPEPLETPGPVPGEPDPE